MEEEFERCFGKDLDPGPGSLACQGTEALAVRLWTGRPSGVIFFVQPVHVMFCGPT